MHEGIMYRTASAGKCYVKHAPCLTGWLVEVTYCISWRRGALDVALGKKIARLGIGSQKDEKINLGKWISLHENFLRTDPSFFPLRILSPDPQRPMPSGHRERRPPGKRQTSSHPQELGGHRALAGAVGCKRAQVHWGFSVHPGQIDMDSPGRRPFLPTATARPPVLHPIALQMARMCRKSFNATKTKG